MQLKKLLTYFSMAAFAMLVYSCTDEEVLKDPAIDNPQKEPVDYIKVTEKICFDGFVKAGSVESRSEDATNESIKASASGFGVFAGVVSEANFNPDIMNNQQVVCNVNKWTYEPEKEWPEDGNVDFYAYYPFSSDAMPGEDADPAKTYVEGRGTTISLPDGSGQTTIPWIRYRPGTDPRCHIDLMRAAALNKGKDDGVVNLEFQHMLAKVGFKLSEGDMSRIQKISLHTNYTVAELNLVSGVWRKDDNTPNYFEFNDFNSSGTQINKSDAFIYMVPETGTTENRDAYTVKVEYNDRKGELKTYEKVIKPGWEAGKSYEIDLIINEDFDVNVQQVNLGIKVDVGSIGSRGDCKIVSLTEVGGTTNLLHKTLAIGKEGWKTIGVKDFDFVSMKNGATYNVIVENGKGVRSESTVEYNWAEMSYTLTEATAELPFKKAESTIYPKVVVVCGDAYTDEISGGKSNYGWTSTPTSTKYTIRTGQVDFTKRQIADLGFFSTSHHWNHTDKPELLKSLDSPLLNMESIEALCNNAKNLEKIHEHLFAYCHNATSASVTFAGCGALKEIPAGLFDNCPKISSFNSTFSGCTKLTEIPAGLFDNCPDIKSFRQTFRSCISLTAIPIGLFGKGVENTTFEGTFYGCEGLTSIPEGLFDNNTKVTSFDGVFQNCVGIQGIPVGLFDNCPEVTNFEYGFFNCPGLTSIPTNLFKNNTKVTSFDWVFYGCTKLTEIPAGLFDNCPDIKSFIDSFGGCRSLTAIPARLFDNCPDVITFSSTFSGCSKLTEIPAGLFDKNTKVISFEATFFGNAIKDIPSGLFDKCEGVKIFQRTFMRCIHLTGEVPELWKTHSSADGEECFAESKNAANYSSIPDSWK